MVLMISGVRKRNAFDSDDGEIDLRDLLGIGKNAIHGHREYRDQDSACDAFDAG